MENILQPLDNIIRRLQSLRLYTAEGSWSKYFSPTASSKKPSQT